MGNCVWLMKQSDTELKYAVVAELPVEAWEEEKQSLLKVRLKTDVPIKEQKGKKSNHLIYPEKYYSDLLQRYFRMDIDLQKEYQGWSEAHSHFKSAATSNRFKAIRVLNQDPVENLFSFICSQNNHISRISAMVEKLCLLYGKEIGVYENQTFHSFPSVQKLSVANVENELRANGFGYRAKFIQKSAQQILEKGNLLWFKNLQELDYKESKHELVQLCGIGPKVADCICLMSLGHLNAIPVDTHIYQIAQNNYMNLKTVKSLTPKLYNDIGDKFRDIYGPLAGWAQTVLFCADLKQFKDEGNCKNKKQITKRKASERNVVE